MNNVFQLLQECFAAQNFEAGKKTLFPNGQQDGIPNESLHIYQPLASRSGNRSQKYIDHISDLQAAYDIALILGTKHVKETQYYIACALEGLKEGGVLMIAADNKENGKRFQKWFETLGLSPQIISAHKAKCAVVIKEASLDLVVLREWAIGGEVQLNQDHFYARPGLFSWEQADAASKFLIETIDGPIKGHVADFGCGYGYLSRRVLTKFDTIKSITGFDDDIRALECFEKNIQPHSEECKVVWADLSRPYKHSSLFDVIIMNPPFHEGRKEVSNLGQSFIANAAQNLRRGGSLWMVANTHLPYEKILEAHFFSFEEIKKDRGFKVIKAIK